MTIRGHGMFDWYGIEAPLQHRMEAIRAAGFDAVMLWWGDELAFAEHDKAGVVGIARDAGLAIENIHVPFDAVNQLWSPDAELRGALVAKHLEWMQDCAEFEIPTMVMHVSRGSLHDGPNRDGLAALEALCREAERFGVTLALENTRSVDLLRSILLELDSPSLGLCYDTSHGRLYERRAFELLEEFPHRLRSFHISDNDGLDDSHWNIDEGVIDWDAFIRSVPAQFDGRLSLEILPKAGEGEAALLHTAYRRVRELATSLV